MYRVAICEDEAPVRESLHRMCGELLAELDVPNEITTFSRAEALKTDLRRHHQPESVTIRTGAGVTVLPLDRLWYVESRDHVLVAQLEQVTREQVVSAAQKLKLDTVYFLKGKE